MAVGGTGMLSIAGDRPSILPYSSGGGGCRSEEQQRCAVRTISGPINYCAAAHEEQATSVGGRTLLSSLGLVKTPCSLHVQQQQLTYVCTEMYTAPLVCKCVTRAIAPHLRVP